MNKTELPKHDFPGWLPPALVKELRQGLKSLPFIVTFIFFPCALSFLFGLGFIETPKGTLIDTDLVNGLYWSILVLSIIVILPMKAQSSVKDELQSRSSDLLILTKLTPWRIVWGKWCSHMGQLLLIACMVMPFMFVRYYYGSMDVANDLFAMLYLMLLSILAISMFIWISGLHGSLRMISSIAYFILVIFAVIFYFQEIRDSDWDDKMSFFYILSFYVFLFSFCFLLLASRFFAPTTMNSSAPLRIAIFLFLTGPALFYAIVPESYDDLNPLIYILLVFASFLFAFELAPKDSINSHHAADARKSRLSWLKMLFFLPGFFSASLCSLLFYSLLGAVSVLFSYLHNQSLEPGFLGECLIWWANMVIVAFFVQLMSHKFKKAAPIVFFVTVGILCFFSVLFHQFHGAIFIQFFPWWNIIDSAISSNSANSALIPLCPLALLMSLKYFHSWKNAIKNSKETTVQ